MLNVRVYHAPVVNQKGLVGMGGEGGDLPGRVHCRADHILQYRK